jgi:hypothetical protein
MKITENPIKPGTLTVVRKLTGYKGVVFLLENTVGEKLVVKFQNEAPVEATAGRRILNHVGESTPTVRLATHFDVRFLSLAVQSLDPFQFREVWEDFLAAVQNYQHVLLMEQVKSITVYLIGHGRVKADEAPAIVPDGITMHWLGPQGDTTKGLSYHFLNGALTQEHGDPDGPGSTITQHILCPEGPESVNDYLDSKIKNFFDRQIPHPHGSEDAWVLYTQGGIHVSLSSIFTFLKELSPTKNWHVYWTCCRGYIGQINNYETTFTKETQVVQRVRRKNPCASPAVPRRQILTASFGTVRIVGSKDKRTIRSEMRGQEGWMKSQTKAIEAIRSSQTDDTEIDAIHRI